MDIDTILAHLDVDGWPGREEVSLVRQRMSLTMTVPKNQWHDGNRTLDEPGTVECYTLPDEGIMVVDFDA